MYKEMIFLRLKTMKSVTLLNIGGKGGGRLPKRNSVTKEEGGGQKQENQRVVICAR